MRKLILTIAALMAATAPAHAVTINPGGSVNTTVLGTASIYQIFGRSGSNNNDATDAVRTDFSAGAGRVFSFSASGTIGCCGGVDGSFTPDGSGGGMNITGLNGLSSLSGTTRIPLVGVFTSESDPFGNAAPSALSFDANTPGSLSPLLNQVFYIGDGLSGYNNALGSALAFTAPNTATRLYLGGIDAFGFGGTSAAYGDNPGSFAVTINLAAAPGIPEPATWAMMIAGFGLIGGAMRTRRRSSPVTA